MADLQDLQKIIEVGYPGRVSQMATKDGTMVNDIRFAPIASEEEKLAISVIVSNFDWTAAPPDIAGFFDALGKAIVIDQALPPEIYPLALILKDQKELKYQQIMLQALASNPVYTKEQKLVLNSLLKQYNLLLPEVATK